MIPFIAIPHVQLPTTQTAPVPATHTEISTLQLPINAVPSAPTVLAAKNNLKGSPEEGDRAIIDSENEEKTEHYEKKDISTQAQNVRFSSPFMAQWLAQANSEEMQAIVQYYANDNTPSTTWNSGLMDWFSEIKFLPSTTFSPENTTPIIDETNQPSTHSALANSHETTLSYFTDNTSLQINGADAYIATFARNYNYLSTNNSTDIRLAL